MKIKNILLIGLGSIAGKHLKIIRRIDKKIKVFKLKIKNKKKALAKIEEILKKFRVNSAVICSPADTHLHYINFFKKKKINYLVEKPIIKDSQLKFIIKNFDYQNNLTEMVGYQLRYNNILLRIKKIMSLKSLGKVYRAKIFVHSYLPNWRKKKLNKSISLSKKSGGGVLLELSHEIDNILWIFGKPNYLRSFIHKNKLFKKDIDEEVLVLFYYKNLILQLEMSFNSRFENRGLIIEGSKASINADLIKNKITINKFNKQKVLYKTNQDNTDMLFKQMNNFIKSVEKNYHKNNIKSSLETLRLISLIRKSNLQNKKVIIK